MLKQLNKCKAWYNSVTLKSYSTIVAFFNNKNQKFYLYRYPSNTTARHFRKFFKCTGVHGIFEFLYNQALKNNWRYVCGYWGVGAWVCEKISRDEYQEAFDSMRGAVMTWESFESELKRVAGVHLDYGYDGADKYMFVSVGGLKVDCFLIKHEGVIDEYMALHYIILIRMLADCI